MGFILGSGGTDGPLPKGAAAAAGEMSPDCGLASRNRHWAESVPQRAAMLNIAGGKHGSGTETEPSPAGDQAETFHDGFPLGLGGREFYRGSRADSGEMSPESSTGAHIRRRVGLTPHARRESP